MPSLIWLRLAGAAVIAVSFYAPPVHAQNYPWCSNFADGAGTNCGWSTEEQCRITVQGSGGYCSYNTSYKAPGAPAPQRHRTQRDRRALHAMRRTEP